MLKNIPTCLRLYNHTQNTSITAPMPCATNNNDHRSRQHPYQQPSCHSPNLQPLGHCHGQHNNWNPHSHSSEDKRYYNRATRHSSSSSIRSISPSDNKAIHLVQSVVTGQIPKGEFVLNSPKNWTMWCA
jgi:hypothetical protein